MAVSVRVLGSGALASALARARSEEADSSAVGTRSSPSSECEIGLDQLHLAFEPGVAGARHPPASPSPSAEQDTSADVVVLADETFDAARALRANAEWLAANQVWLPALTSPLGVQVGPVIVPGRGPCLRCCWLRLRAAERLRPAPSWPTVEPRRRLEVVRAAGHQLLGVLLRGSRAEGSPEASLWLAPWQTGRFERHPIIRAAECPDCRSLGPHRAFRFADPPLVSPCSEPAEPGTAGQAPPPLEELLARWVDPITGPLVEFEGGTLGPSEPRVHHYRAAYAQVEALSGPGEGGEGPIWGAGTALDPAAAKGAAFGEAIERAHVHPPPGGDLLQASFEELGPDAIDPRAWDVFHPATRARAGFPYRSPSPSTHLEWVRGWSLTEDRPRWIPAYRVFVGTRAGERPAPWDYPIVSGFAASTSMAQACRRGLLEVLERDSFMIAWANRLPLERLAPRALAPRALASRALASGSEASAIEGAGSTDAPDLCQQIFGPPSQGHEARCFGLRLDHGVPFALAMLRSERAGDPAFVVAAAADEDMATAARRALAELASVYLAVRTAVQNRREPLPDARPESVIEMHDHALLYARRDMQPVLEPWWSSPPAESPVAEPRSRGLSALVGRARALGLEVLVVDLTRPELRDTGLRVVKILVPGTYPMNFDSRWPQLGGRRMAEAPVRAGLLSRARTFREYNRIPHPFP